MDHLDSWNRACFFVRKLSSARLLFVRKLPSARHLFVREWPSARLLFVRFLPRLLSVMKLHTESFLFVDCRWLNLLKKNLFLGGIILNKTLKVCRDIKIRITFFRLSKTLLCRETIASYFFSVAWLLHLLGPPLLCRF